MRIDKFLKVSRIIKRRSIAKEVTEQGRVRVNGNIAKASTTVKEGDTLSIMFGQKELVIKINEVKETAKKEEATNMFEMISEKQLSDKE